MNEEKVNIKHQNTSSSIMDLIIKNDLVSFFIIDREGLIIDTNQCFASALGFSVSELLSKSISKIISDIESFIQKISGKEAAITIIQPFIAKNKDSIQGYLCGKRISNNLSDPIYCFHFINLKGYFDDLSSIQSHNANFKLKDELLLTKEVELKKQNSELIRLNNALLAQTNNIENLNVRIIENEMRLKLAFEAVNDGIWDWNLITGNIFFSDRFFTMLGYGAYDYSHTMDSWHSMVYPDDLPLLKEHLSELVSGNINEFTQECRMRTVNGNYTWILSRASTVDLNEQGKPQRIIGTQLDIDHQKGIEIALKENEAKLLKQNEEYVIVNKQLAESNQKTIQLFNQLQDKQAYLNSIFRSVPAMICLISNRIILFANNYASLMTGYDIDELLGQDTLLLYSSVKEYEKVFNLLYSDNGLGSIKSANTQWQMKNGTIIDVYITATHIESDVSQETYTFSAIDVTSQRLYEEELIAAKVQAEKAERLKTTFLCNMSHELRTPMNGIVGFSEMLQTQVTQAKKDEYLKVITNSSKQLLKIISDIIDISKIETNGLEVFYSPVNLPKLFIELHETYLSYLETRHKEHITLYYENCLFNNCENIIVDENKLKQILSNLLNNAVKFTDEGEIRFGCKLLEKEIEFYVSDTGIGIDAEELTEIFECFRQTESPTRKKYGGNGLGLAIAKGFVEILDGKIWVKSVKDSGSTFYFTIPFKPDNEQMNIETMDRSTLKWPDFHILVVEDDLTCLILIDEMLADTGIKISHAVTGLEAVKACRKDQSIDLVLMDMRLPEIDGYEATRRIKELRPQLPIIAQTAHALSEDRQKCLQAGCNEYITKPINQDNLFDMIDLFLSKR